MLTTTTPRAVTTHGVTETASFTIKANGKAFKVLIDGLYSDKVRAVIRELWSNAFDAHRDAGNDEPFECHLPTTLDPVFSVRDYGTGMSHEQIMTLYTTVFGSSKENTNTQVGKLGLGSKSPFAYCDTFTVTAWDGETKRLYSAYIGSDYIPRISVMGSMPSTEPRGIEVSFPVKPQDVTAFVTAANATILGFEPRPIIKGATLSNSKPFNPVMTGNGWKLVKADYWGLRAHARQGCVIYPIDVNAVSGLTPAQQAILQSAIFIDFPIGSLEISASRESLGYDEPTKATIRNKVIEIEAEIGAVFQAEVDKCRTRWEAVNKIRSIMARGLDRAVSTIVRNSLKWKGRQIDEMVNISDIFPKVSRPYESGGVKVMVLSEMAINHGKITGKRNSLAWEPMTYGGVTLGDLNVVIDDVDADIKSGPQRIRHWYYTNNRTGTVLWIKAKLNSMALKRVLVGLGRPPEVFHLSKMDRPPMDKTGTSRNKVGLKALRENGHQTVWQKIVVAEGDEVVYVELDRMDVVGPVASTLHSWTVADVRLTRDVLTKLGYLNDGTRIIGVPKTLRKLIARNKDTWTCLWDIARKALADKYDASKAAIALAHRQAQARFGELDVFFKALVKDKTFEGFACIGPAQALYDYWAESYEIAETLKSQADLMSLHNIMDRSTAPSVTSEPTLRHEPLTTAVETTYPLLKRALDGYDPDFNRNSMAPYIQYVDLIDFDAGWVQCKVTNDDLAA